MKKITKPVSKPSKSISRREFLGSAALAATAITIVPRHVLGGPGYMAPSDKLNIACVGVGGKGRSDIAAVATENIYALCDVDDNHMAERAADYPQAKKYRDFRKMLQENRNSIDAVTVSTPDHTHAVIALMAAKMEKHVFVQKPLTATIEEARLLAKAVKDNNVVSQMGNQGHAGEGARLINEWIWSGAIGQVNHVHVWTNRPIWPQGNTVKRPETVMDVPDTLDWNLWLGPAKFRPYYEGYHPFAWRGWWDFGTGALGDMGAHLIDQPYWALKLGRPTSVEVSSTPFNEESYPVASVVRYEFPEREGMDACRLTWYDGGLMPQRPHDLEPGRKMGDGGGGCLFVGEKGTIMCGTYGDNPRLIPETAMKEFDRPEKTIPRSPGIHEEWVAAIKGGPATTSNFDYASQLTEMMLLGNVALKVKEANKKLLYDAEKMEFTNHPDANQFLSREYHGGFSLI